MLKNYLKIAFRHLRKHKGYALLNVLGLTLGLASFVLIFLFVQYEFSYDRHHENADQIYRVTSHQHMRGRDFTRPLVSKELGPTLESTFPAVQKATRLVRERQQRIRQGEAFYAVDPFYAEPSAFEVFSFTLLQGDAQTALERPHTTVLTASTAHKLFGDQDPVGQTLTLTIRNQEQAFEIIGVMEDMPATSHLSFDVLLSLESLYATGRTYNWTRGRSFRTYLQLEGTSEALTTQLPDIALQNLGAEWIEERQFRYDLEPLTEIYFAETGAKQYVYLFSAIAVLILLIACANYMNLITARAATRSHEVGLRKVLGAQRKQLAGQFFGESLLMTCLALPAALWLVVLVLPTFNQWFEKDIALNLAQNSVLVLGLTGLVLLVGLLAGSYPALFLSAFKPADVLRSGFLIKQRTAYVRKALIVFQFTVTVALIASTLVIQQQLEYAQHQDLGFSPDRTLAISVTDPAVAVQIDAFKASLSGHAGIEQVAAMQGIMAGLTGGQWSFRWEINPDRPGTPDVIGLYAIGVDYEAMETMGLEMLAGRIFSEYHPTDAQGIILNETATQQLGWLTPEEAVGAALSEGQPIVGVVKDFDIFSKHHEVQPVALRIVQDKLDTVVLRLADAEAPLAFIEEQWHALAPNEPFVYYFLEDGIADLYREEQRLAQLVGWFSGLAIFIACLGLFGLTAFMAQRRTKEIGIRKVFGASIPGIVVLLSKEITALVLVALVVASPTAYIVMNGWLQAFAYHTEIGVSLFVTVGGLAVFMALLTISAQSVKAALANPIEALRHE